MGELPPGQFWGHRFVIYTVNGVPEVDEKSFRFVLSGLVDRELDMGYADLESAADGRLEADFHCVTKWSIRDCVWEGIPFSVLSEKAGVRDKAGFAFARCLDGYTTVIPMENMTDAFLALRLNSEKLSPEQGAPLRLVVPTLYGWKSAKWLAGLEILKEYRDGFWEERGYHERGDFTTEERFKNPLARFIHKKTAPARRK